MEYLSLRRLFVTFVNRYLPTTKKLQFLNIFAKICDKKKKRLVWDIKF